MNTAFWQGRRVLLTGHTGFKGAWLALWLARLGARVTGLALDPPTDPSLFALARVGGDLTDRRGDVRERAAVDAAFQAGAPEVVFHLAAQALVRESYADPVGTFATNVLGTAHVLEAARTAPGLRAVLVVTSDKCYANDGAARAFREGDPLGGHDPYSASKAGAEIVTGAYRDSFLGELGIGLASIRAGNVIGGGDWSTDRLLPDAVRAWSAGAPIRLRNPAATRPWQHVLEPLAGYLMLAERLAADPAGFAGAYNLGPSPASVQPVATVIDEAAALWGGGARWEQDPGTHPHEAATLSLDSAKAGTRLGWHSRWPLARALAETVHWYLRARAGDDPRTLTLAQIDAYAKELHD